MPGQLHPLVEPQVSHLRHVPLRTSVKFPQFAAGIALIALHPRFADPVELEVDRLGDRGRYLESR